MWKPLIGKKPSSAARKLHLAQMPGTLAPRAKEASMVGRTGWPTGVLVVAAAVFSLAALAFSASAASSQNRSPQATKAFHATKDCSGFTGLAGAFCTIRSSNVKAVKVGSKIFYFQMAGKTALNSDIAIYVGPGNVATGHCLLRFATGVGLCTISDGTGTLAGFHAPCTCHGRFVDPQAVALGRDVQLQTELEPVGNRPVSERGRRWLSSLSAKYIAVFALLVAVPVICTSVYLLYSSYQDNKRALTRLQQEKAKSVAVTIDQYFIRPDQQDDSDVGPLPVLHRTGLGASTPAQRERDRCVLHRQHRAEDARKRRRRARPGQGKLPPRSFGRAGEGGGGLLRSRVRATARLSDPGARSMEVLVAESYDRTAPRIPRKRTSSARRSISESFRTLSGRRGSGRPDTSTRSTPKASRSPTRTRPPSRIVLWLFLR